MAEGITNIAGIEIPSTDPIFLAVVGVHILLGLACTVTGAIAMLSQKRAGRHPRYGTIYFWCLAGIFLTASGLAASRWAEDYHLFVLGTMSFAAAYFGRQARRQRWHNWVRLHITGMGTSCFGVKNGKTQQEQMFSAQRPTADIVSDAVWLRREAAFHNRPLCESSKSCQHSGSIDSAKVKLRAA